MDTVLLALSFRDWSSLEFFFLICAAVGGSLFLIRLVMMFVAGGADFDGDADVNVDVDINADVDAGGDAHMDAHGDTHGGTHGGDTDISFRLLSIQGVTAFFTMFGLVGLAMMRQSGQDEIRSIAAGCVAGAGTVWLMKLIFSKVKTLQSSGNIYIHNAIGQEGDVYLTIPPGGVGKAQVRIQDHLKIWDARTEGDGKIETGRRVRVLRVVEGNVLIVEEVAEA
ncbi:MAG: hypothetical protein JW810_01550 [Sedimentisphaerales bacterium]|nr:hypothetical protein [Sedimentisphaerales bacterium]